MRKINKSVQYKKSMSNIKKTRGQSYDINRLQELMDDGLTSKEIADELGTKSVQSIRHSMEAIQRKTDAIRAYKNRQRMEEEKVYSVNRVGLFPYVADDLSIKALKYLLPRSGTGFKIVYTRDGYTILVDPDTNLTSARSKLKKLGIYCRLCSKKDGGKQIGVIRKPSSDERIKWPEMMGVPFFILYHDDDQLEKLQAFFYPYLEEGTISSTELGDMTLGEVEDPEYALKSMQLDIENSPWHVHIEYDPLLITQFGYIPVELNGDDMQLIPKETLNNLGNRINEEISQKFSQDMDQFVMAGILCKMAGGNWKVFRKNSNREVTSNYLTKIIESIPIFMTEEIRQKLEEEIDKNAEYVNKILEREGSYISNLI